jgi:hypothetical protein
MRRPASKPNKLKLVYIDKFGMPSLANATCDAEHRYLVIGAGDGFLGSPLTDVKTNGIVYLDVNYGRAGHTPGQEIFLSQTIDGNACTLQELAVKHPYMKVRVGYSTAKKNEVFLSIHLYGKVPP